MNLPEVITELINAQEQFDSKAYANCFSETAIVVDEGKTYQGRAEIEEWIKMANDEYQTKMKPISYSEDIQTLKAEISGRFEGSPLILHYYFDIADGLIRSLETKLPE
jgi:hypothetical protein